jgi:hypothetical protein
MVYLIIHLVLLVTIVGTASLWVPKSTALNVLVASDLLSNGMQMQARQYLNVSTGFYLVLQPDCNVILYNRSQPIMSTNTSCGNMFGFTFVTASLTISLQLAETGSLTLTQSQSNLINDSSVSDLWSYSWAVDGSDYSGPLFPYMILRASGSCDFYDFNGSHLNGSDGNGDPSFLQRYWGPVPRQAPNASALSSLPDIAYPFPPELAWKPQASLDNFPYLPAGYFLSQGSQLQTTDLGFSLVLGPGCNLQSKRSLDQNGSAEVLWETGSSNSSEGGGCELTLQEDGRLVTRNNVSGAIYWNSSTVAGNVSASWVLRLSAADGSLSIGDIENSSNILWTNVHPNQTNRATTWIVVGVTVGVFVLAMAGSALFYFHARTSKHFMLSQSNGG